MYDLWMHLCACMHISLAWHFVRIRTKMHPQIVHLICAGGAYCACIVHTYSTLHVVQPRNVKVGFPMTPSIRNPSQ